MFEDSLAPHTPYDLHFHIGDISVRVHPYFWLTTVLLGLHDTNQPPLDVLLHLLAWVAVLFVSILVHELGHVLMGRQFGSRGHIILTGLCGLAVGSSTQSQRWQRICVYLSGPGAGFLLAGATIGVFYLIYPEITILTLRLLIHLPLLPLDAPDIRFPPPIVHFIFINMLWVNIFWGLINLLPIWPLDGGQVCREICEAVRRRDGLRLSVQISMFTAATFAILALVEILAKKPLIPFLPLGGLFSVIFFGLLAYNSYQLFVFVQRSGPGWKEEFNDEPREPWEQDADWWKK